MDIFIGTLFTLHYPPFNLEFVNRCYTKPRRTQLYVSAVSSILYPINIFHVYIILLSKKKAMSDNSPPPFSLTRWSVERLPRNSIGTRNRSSCWQEILWCSLQWVSEGSFIGLVHGMYMGLYVGFYMGLYVGLYIGQLGYTIYGQYTWTCTLYNIQWGAL